MVATFSIVGFDPETDSLGVAVQSMFLAVGALVPYARAAVGARLGYFEGHDPGDGETLLDALTDFLYRSGLLMSQCLHRLHPPRVAGESLEERGVFPVGLKRLGECLLE